MVASDIRKEARSNLTGKWGKGALITLVYGVIVYVLQWLLNLVPVVGPIVSLVIEIPIGYGIIVSFLKLKRGEEVSYIGFLQDGFKAFKKSWSVALNMILKLIAPFILMIVSYVMMIMGLGVAAVGMMGSAGAYNSASLAEATAGATGVGSVLGFIGVIGVIATSIWLAVKSLYYVLSYYILADNENLTGKEIVEKSAEYMKGNRWNYFFLGLTFIGWAILAAIPMGIGYFWLAPYMMVSMIIFYEDKAGIKKDTVQKAEPAKIEETTEPEEPTAE